jgi:hypothetical protein
MKRKSSSERGPIDSRPADGKVIIGWTEAVDFVDWGITRLNAKIDTGARTSALHVENMDFLPDEFASFEVVLSRRHQHRRKHVVAKISRWGKVRSSNGHYTNRCFVHTTIRIGPVEKEIELSLVSREKMTYRMLLGREALEKDFVIDVSRRRVQTAKRKKPRTKS